MPAFPDVALSTAEIVPGAEWEITAQVSEDLDIPWLIRFWFTDSDNVALLGQESLETPSTPGVSQFHKVTDANGQCVFSIKHTGALAKFLNATVIGRVTTTVNPLIFL